MGTTTTLSKPRNLGKTAKMICHSARCGGGGGGGKLMDFDNGVVRRVRWNLWDLCQC